MAEGHLRRAVQATQRVPLRQPGLLVGTAGLALTVADFCDDEPRYRPSLNQLHRLLAAQARRVAWRRPEPGVAAEDYDAVGGAAGVLAYLAGAHPEAGSRNGAGAGVEVRAAVEHLLEYLVWLGGPDGTIAERRGPTAGASRQRRWVIPPRLYPMDWYREPYPHGYLNLGMSHGMPGPLAALALAWLAGYRVPGQREAIEHIADWLLEARLDDAAGPNWPPGVALAQDGREQPPDAAEVAASRTAWCYGAPGVAASLRLAGDALDDDRLRNVASAAVAAFTGLGAAPPARSPTLCHGNAGILTVSLHFAHLADCGAAREQVPALVERILARCDPELPLVVQDVEEVDPSGRRRERLVDVSGFLSGAAGVALALLAASTDVPPRWGRALLLA